MQIVIDIPKTFYNDIAKSDNIHLGEVYANKIVKIIKNGTPLPKGHGRLIDADALIKSTDKEEVHMYEIALAPTIIEADKGSEDKHTSGKDGK